MPALLRRNVLTVKQKKKLKKKPLDCSQHVRIDLHIHSTASDGTLSPSEILSLAQSLNLGAIAITDHDTIEGSKEALRIGIPAPLKFLTGVEISASPPQFFVGSGSIHILGYSMRLEDPTLNQTLQVLQESRETRNPRIIERLKNLGIDIDLKDVLKQAGNGQLGRPHIATVLLKKKYVKSIREAFDKYLAKGKPAYVDKDRVECDRAIEIILGAGGIPVLAHPVLLGYPTNKALEDFVRSLKTMGLKGIEVYYPDHSPAQTAYYTELANHFDLLMTGGTDFHGSLKPDLKMGTGRGNLFIPYDLYERLIQSG
jgi:predicted metal-dependent phosphoesterase TrpH